MRRYVIWIIAVFLFTPLNQEVVCAEIEYSSQESIQLELFSGFSASVGRIKCEYKFEKDAYAPSFYEDCVNWVNHKKLEHIGPGIISGIEVNDGQMVLLGHPYFELVEKIAFDSVYSDRTTLNGNHGLRVNLLGVALPLPKQRFSVQMRNGADYHTAEWGWNTFDLHLHFPIPTSLGTMEIDFGIDFGGTYENYSNRSAFYRSFSKGTSKHDWLDWAQGESTYWSPLTLTTNWGLGISSPSIGGSIAGIGGGVRMRIGGSIAGSWRYRDKYIITRPDIRVSNDPPTWQRTGNIFTKNELIANAGLNAQVIAYVEVLGFEYSEEYEIFNVNRNKIQDLDGTNGHRIAQISFKYSKPPTSFQKCPEKSPRKSWEVPQESWLKTNLSSVPLEKAEEKPTDLRKFAEDFSKAVQNRFFLCNRSKQKYNPAKDTELKKLCDQLKFKIPPSEREIQRVCDVLGNYLEDRCFLCEKVESKGIGIRIYRKPSKTSCGWSQPSANKEPGK